MKEVKIVAFVDKLYRKVVAELVSQDGTTVIVKNPTTLVEQVQPKTDENGQVVLNSDGRTPQVSLNANLVPMTYKEILAEGEDDVILTFDNVQEIKIQEQFFENYKRMMKLAPKEEKPLEENLDKVVKLFD